VLKISRRCVDSVSEVWRAPYGPTRHVVIKRTTAAGITLELGLSRYLIPMRTFAPTSYCITSNKIKIQRFRA